ncbi:MAG: cysteine desulfurase family protein, partial [Candidatus Promineifilaceae bacterium]
MNERHIYMDHGASTPVRQEVVEAMLPYWTDYYGNPASSHFFGREASQGLERSRRQIAELLNARPTEIVFTGCGSESDNLALRGVMWAAREQGRGNHLIVSAIEHSAVLGTAKQLRDHFDFDVTILPVDGMGKIDLGELEEAIRPNTVLISIMAANNEIGTFQPFEAIGRLAHEHGVLYHTDAVQAAAYVPWNLESQPIDLMSIAPHKFYGPKGIGILYVEKDVQLISSLTGGSQEDGRRAGTVNVPFAVGAAEALRLAMEEREQNIAHYELLRDRLIDGVLAALPEECLLTGHPTDRLPHNASFA